MRASAVNCSRCQATLLGDLFNRAGFTPCPNCRAPIQVRVFPALFRELAAGSVGERVLADGEASCFHHPEKKAVLPCDGCGRFLCALCDVELNGQHLCPACIEGGRRKGKLATLENKRVLYDRMALYAATLPALILWPSLLGAPIALFLVIRYWKEPCSLVRPSKWRFVVAAVLALLQIFAWVVFFVILAR